MGRLTRKLQTLIPLPRAKLSSHMSFSRLPKTLHVQRQKSSSVLKRLASVPPHWAPSTSTPKGHLPIRVASSAASDGLLYFIKAEHLAHPLILDLLQSAADEFGYSRIGALQVICDADAFEDILQMLISS